MIKRLVLVASVCLTALVISSCSDNSTQSGVELGLAGTDVAPTAADNLDVEGSPYNRSASCDLVFAGTKYVDYILHKVLAKCDSVNKYYAYHGKPHSTATLIQALDNWCTSQHGSTTDPPPLNWSTPIVRKRRIRYGNQETQTRRDCNEAKTG